MVDGRFEPVPGTGAEHPGRSWCCSRWASPARERDGLVEQLGVDLDPRGNIARDEHYATSRVPGVFVCGDAGRGQSLIVWAIAEGRSCANGVDAYLQGSSRLPAADQADRPAPAGLILAGCLGWGMAKSESPGRLKKLKQLAALGARLPLPSGPTPIKAPLDIASKFTKAWDAGDAKAISELFAEDADFVNVVGLWWTSRRSIRRALKRGFAEWFAGSTFAVEKLSQRLLGSDAALIIARWRIEGQRDPEGERRGSSSWPGHRRHAAARGRHLAVRQLPLHRHRTGGGHQPDGGRRGHAHQLHHPDIARCARTAGTVPLVHLNRRNRPRSSRGVRGRCPGAGGAGCSCRTGTRPGRRPVPRWRCGRRGPG